jgi:predicted nucleic acid-binding protein
VAVSYVLDTNVLLYHLGGRLSEPLPDGPLHASVVSEIELLSYPGLTVSDELVIEAMLRKLVIVELEPLIKRGAIMIRRQHRLKLPDAVIGATARFLSAMLITNDLDFEKVSSLRTQRVSLL